MKKISIASTYDRRRVRVQTVNNEPSMADDSQRAETDVNNIMSRIRYHQLPDPVQMYNDLSEVGDLLSAHESIQKANAVFDSLPAKLRAKFDNQPAKLIEYLQDPKNDAEAISLGLRSEDPFMPKKPSIDNVDEETKRSAVGTTKKTKQTKTTDDDSSET